MNKPPVLSYVQVRPILRARREGAARARTSTDLGLTTTEVPLQPEGILLPDGQQLSWPSIEEISRNETACYLVEDGELFRIQSFSDTFHRFYGLMPTERAPTLLVSGIPMHRIKGTDPVQDTRAKVRTIAPITGWVLDTCTGLGYTAVEAARTADRVTTIELDPAVLDIARQNPWSQSLFSNTHIEQIVGDAFDEIQALEDGSFSRIIHDPPMFSLAGDLYSGEFYRHMFRVLKSKGRVFHYIGDLESRSGRNVVRGVAQRLQEAGFSRVIRKPEAFGVVAIK
jgi:predicted methyltransferase